VSPVKPTAQPRRAHSGAAAPGGTETVLVVEDEAGLRRVARRILEKHAYKVLTAADGEEALQVLADHLAGVDLVVTDLAMPKLGGAALYQRVQTELGPMRFLVASGYSALEAQERQDLPADLPFLSKPWTLAGLLVSVRAALDGPVLAFPIVAAASRATTPTAA